MADETCKECGGEVEVGELCQFCGTPSEGIEKCGTVKGTWVASHPSKKMGLIYNASVDISDVSNQGAHNGGCLFPRSLLRSFK